VDHAGDHPSRLAGAAPIAPTIGCGPQTLHEGAQKVEVDSGTRAAVPTVMADRL